MISPRVLPNNTKNKTLKNIIHGRRRHHSEKKGTFKSLRSQKKTNNTIQNNVI